MVIAETQLEICSYHQIFAKHHEKDSFVFSAFNLNTGQALPVTAHGKVLSICKSDVQFSQQKPNESRIVERLQDIIDRPTYDENTDKSVHSTNFRAGLQNLLWLYSSTSESQSIAKQKSPSLVVGKAPIRKHHETPEALKIHEISFIELTFSIVGRIEYTNNFAAIVPISNKTGEPTALLPFNGGIWETAYDNADKCFIQSHIKLNTTDCDDRVLQLRILFGNREVMFAGIDLIAPFLNICAVREKIKRKTDEEYMILNQNTETYVMMYGILLSIGRSQVLMTEHPMYMEIVKNILLATLNIFGYGVNVSSHELINNFFSVLCYCMHMGQIGHNCYREDIVAEDIRKRSTTRSLPAFCCTMGNTGRFRVYCW